MDTVVSHVVFSRAPLRLDLERKIIKFLKIL